MERGGAVRVGGWMCVCGRHPLGRCPQADTPWDQTPQRKTPPGPDTHQDQTPPGPDTPYPGTRHPLPWGPNTPQADTPQDQKPAPGLDTPLGRHPWDQIPPDTARQTPPDRHLLGPNTPLRDRTPHCAVHARIW